MSIADHAVRRFSMLLLCAAVVLAGGSVMWAQEAPARLSDDDVQALIQNLKGDAKQFQSSFNKGVKKSTVRGTTREKDVMNLVAQFGKDCDALLSQFNKKKTGGAPLDTVLTSGDQIRKFLDEIKVEGTADAWAKITTEMEQVAGAFQVKVPWEEAEG